MRAFAWTETTADWTRPNPYRRHEGFSEATQTHIAIERNRAGRNADEWRWLVSVPHQTGQFWLPGGDLPDVEAKALAPIHLANQLRRLLEALA